MVVFLAAASIAVACGVRFTSAGALLWGLALLLMAAAATRKRTPSGMTAAALILLGLSFADWLTPILFKPGESSFDRIYADGYRANVSDIGAQPNPGTYPSSARASDGRLLYEIHYTIGPDQLRVTPDNPPGPHRVNFLGCSFTYGEGVNDNETLPYFVSRTMQDVHVVNFGFHGYGAHNTLALLESSRNTKGEINFFLGAGFHIERSACHPDWTASAPRYELQGDGSVTRNGKCGDTRGPLDQLKKTAIRYSNIAAAADRFSRTHIGDEDVRLYIAILRRAAELTHARGQKFVIGYITGSEPRLASTSYTDESIMAAFKTFADDVFDARLPRDSRNAIPLDGHPTAFANQKRAVMVAEHLRRFLP